MRWMDSVGYTDIEGGREEGEKEAGGNHFPPRVINNSIVVINNNSCQIVVSYIVRGKSRRKVWKIIMFPVGFHFLPLPALLHNKTIIIIFIILIFMDQLFHD
jgi:hypothetical protein